MNESETRSRLVDPKLKDSGWDEYLIRREVILCPGKIIDDSGTRKKSKRTDYILSYNGMSLAVVESKDDTHIQEDGLQQAKTYAKMLNIPFAYSTNGHGIEEFDFFTNRQSSLTNFPSPEQLWERYLSSLSVTVRAGLDALKISPSTVYKVPRYYQEAATKKCIEGFLEGKNRILLTMATGTGKTLVAFHVVWKLYKAGLIHKVLYIADRKFLRDQAYNAFEAFNDARDIIKEGRAPKNRDIYFTTYQSLFSGSDNKRLFENYDRDFFDLIIIDECHRSGFGMWNIIFKRFAHAVHFGMTATPKRDDNIDTYDYFGTPMYAYSLGRGIDDGFLAPYKIHKIFTNIDKDGILYLRQAQDMGASIYIPEGIEPQDYYTIGEFEEKITLPDRTHKICEHLSDILNEYGPLGKTIVFCVNMDHAAFVARDIQNYFSHLGYYDYAVRIVSEESDVNSITERFADSDKVAPVVATTVDLLSTGIDIPSVRNIVFITPIASKILFKQIIGRGCRIDNSIKKYEFRTIDYTNATRLFDEWDYPSVDLERIEKEHFNGILNAIVVDSETGEPIPLASVVISTRPNEQVTTKTDRAGRLLFSNLASRVRVRINMNHYAQKTITINTLEDMNQNVVIELKKKNERMQRIVIDDLPVFISEETYLELKDGRTLTQAQYVEYSKEELRKRFISLNDLKRTWLSSEKRKSFLDELKERSISPKIISRMVGKPDADLFDIIAHIAFDAPLLTRDDRAAAFSRMKSDFMNSFGTGKDVILALLEKYRIAGIENISDPVVFETSPFDKMGYIKGVARKVGGWDKLKKIIEEIENGLYEENGE